MGMTVAVSHRGKGGEAPPLLCRLHSSAPCATAHFKAGAHAIPFVLCIREHKGGILCLLSIPHLLAY